MLFIRDIQNYQSMNNSTLIIFKNFEDSIIKIAEKYTIDIDECSKLINNSINNINSNGYLQLMITGLFFELNYLFNNKNNLIETA